MATTREQVLQSVMAKLATVPGMTWYRSRQQAVSQTEGVVGIVEPIYETIEEQDLAKEYLRLFEFRLTIITRGAIADLIADAYIEDIEAALPIDDDLGHLVFRLYQTSMQWSMEDADGMGICETQMGYMAEYRS